VSLFRRLGNNLVNAVWEAKLPEGVLKPDSRSTAAAKEAFITNKYANKAFLSSKDAEKQRDQDQVSKDLWSAIEKRDIVGCYEALALLEQPKAPRAEAQLLALRVQSKVTDGIEFMPTHLHAAAQHDDVDIMLLLLLSGKFSVDSLDASGRSPLMYAIFFDNPGVAKILIKHGAKTFAADFEGATPLHWLRNGAKSLRCASDPDLVTAVFGATGHGNATKSQNIS
jgi:hypothetical protein